MVNGNEPPPRSTDDLSLAKATGSETRVLKVRLMTWIAEALLDYRRLCSVYLVRDNILDRVGRPTVCLDARPGLNVVVNKWFLPFRNSSSGPSTSPIYRNNFCFIGRRMTKSKPYLTVVLGGLQRATAVAWSSFSSCSGCSSPPTPMLAIHVRVLYQYTCYSTENYLQHFNPQLISTSKNYVS